MVTTWDESQNWQKANQEQGYKTGKALTSHIMTAHNGEIDDSCPACIEIQRKIRESQGGK